MTKAREGSDFFGSTNFEEIPLVDNTGSPIPDGYVLTYDTISGKWIGQESQPPTWGTVGGTLSDQTDLQTEINTKASIGLVVALGG